MITTAIEALWLRVHALLTVFSDRLGAADPALVRDIGRTSNETFPLRGYLAFRRRNDSDEVAITIDVRNDGQQLTIESEVCTDEGRIIAVGPSASVPLLESQQRVDIATNNWLGEFERFLVDKESAVVMAASQLT